jgi:hypothetical protein
LLQLEFVKGLGIQTTNGRTNTNGGTTDQHDEWDHECYNNKAISYVKVIIEKNISSTVKNNGKKIPACC